MKYCTCTTFIVVILLCRDTMDMMMLRMFTTYLNTHSVTTSGSSSAAAGAGTGSSCATSLVRPVGKVRTAACLVSIAGSNILMYVVLVIKV